GSVGSARANQPYPGDVHIIRPKADVGGGILQPSAPVSTLPPPSSTVYTAPAASSGVSAAPLPPPSGTQRSALAPVAASTPPRQPAVQSATAPAEQVAMLPQVPKQREKSTPRAEAGGSYTVVAGDTLYGISRRSG